MKIYGQQCLNIAAAFCGLFVCSFYWSFQMDDFVWLLQLLTWHSLIFLGSRR
jgi:hypothetical protein